MRALQLVVCLLLTAVATSKHLYTWRGGQLPTSAKSEHREEADRVLCTTIGFDTAAAIKLRHKLFSTVEFTESAVVLRNIDQIEKLTSSELNAPVAVSYIPRLDAMSGGARFLDQVTAYAVNMKHSQSKNAKLHVIVEEGGFASEKAAEEWVRSAVGDVAPPRCKIAVIIHHLAQADADSEQVCSPIRESIMKSLRVAAEDRGNLVSSSSIAKDEERFNKARAGAIGATKGAVEGSRQAKEVKRPHDVDAVLAAAQYVQSFQERVNTSISALLQDGLVSSGSTVNSTVAALRGVLEGAVEEHRLEHAAELLAHGSSAAFQSAVPQCRLHLASTLLPVYRTLTQSMLQGSLGAFDRQVGRLTSTRRLPAQLRVIASAVNKGFARGVEGIRGELMEMIEATAAAACGVQARRAGFGATLRLPQFSADFERRCLEEALRQRSTETLHSLTLSGAYNPYVRETELPPFHINVNYLVDPKALLVGQEYKSLYDEHREGPCETRADPLVFPGIATIPFDPNQHPVSTERVNSWVDVVKDFFSTKE